MFKINAEVCKNCDLDLSPIDCSEHEHAECEFEYAMDRFIKLFGVQAVIEKIEPKLDSVEKKKAIRHLLDKID